ncbi:hypothetical protein ACFQI7_34660 [Paenibacillus allorhizosphaerae]|uniref:Membrane protein YkvI n=1 Tax=Paenibacillus allorhizosphaerae TaxID=2849866 RepID=A0ABM8VSW9_9BACL|nr:hypothetical protein [Paenibacillus allorhizosphaerae]CAG7657084.1 hypothetical protein PAECIP111802_06609 [Paenibacillus allorhizosphaerae]
MKQKILILQIAATYVGTVVGAGFASGQSILQFFTVYGAWGETAILISTFLFIWIGTKMMMLARRIKAFSFQELNHYLFGKTFGKVANILMFILLLGVTSVMLSGTGSIFEEQLGLPYQLGIITSIVLSYLVMTKQIKGILAVNSLVVPMMLFFMALIAANAIDLDELPQFMKLHNEERPDYKWLITPFSYVALNIAFVQAVMVPLANEVSNDRALQWGGFWGGIGLGAMLLVSHYAMHAKMPDIQRFDIPMAEIIRDYGPFMHILFLLVIYGEIFTTLIGNVFGIARQMQSRYELPTSWLVLIILLASFLVSQIGFASLLTYLYPLFGYMGIILLIFLAAKRVPAH